MAELRWNPISKEWVMIASHRQSRPQMPKNWCPFCPGEDNEKVPKDFEVLRYPNDFPALRSDPPVPDDVETDPLFRTAPAYGRCDVLLYSKEHHGTVAELSDDHVHKLAHLWQDEFNDMKRDPKLKYCFIFENRGAVVGVTMPHPHGQAYGYPFLPKKLEIETASALEHLENTGHCLYCDLLAAERKDGSRIIFENDYFTVYVPFFSAVTYAVHITARRHLPDLSVMDEETLCALGETVRGVAGMYDNLYGNQFPYMMCMHNAPINHENPKIVDAFHFHIEFVPPMRSETVQQFFASSETGAGAFCNPNKPEDKAGELREAYGRYLGK
ncbi:MAG: galactose-1-phosphate uridylyltransferase [Oscillospiraceae bacterium]